MTESKLTKEELDKMWAWIDRPLSQEFWVTKGKCNTKEELQKRFDEIPKMLRPLAYAIIHLAMGNKKYGVIGGDKPESCLCFRMQLFGLAETLEKEKEIDLCLPSYWSMDGIMVEPEWIVRITNGIIGWCCDSSINECGMAGRCRFYDEKYLRED